MPKLPTELVLAAIEEISEIPCKDYCHDGDCVLIDVREPGEFQSGSIPGAVNIPRGVLEFMIHTHPKLKCESHPVKEKADTRIVLYCHTGGRAALAALSLQTMGFTDVVSLSGGYQGWSNPGT
jgi:rhodanese-related sulfurtransferase